jgi:hypothetical protein
VLYIGDDTTDETVFTMLGSHDVGSEGGSGVTAASESAGRPRGRRGRFLERSRDAPSVAFADGCEADRRRHDRRQPDRHPARCHRPGHRVGGRLWTVLADVSGGVPPALEGATAIEFTHRACREWRCSPWRGWSWRVFSRVAAKLVSYERARWQSHLDRHRGPHRDGDRARRVGGRRRLVARAVSVPIHLVSTFVLLAGLVMTRFWLTDEGLLPSIRSRERTLVGLIGVGMLVVAATGAVTALADTLFPKEFDLATTVTAGEHFLTRLRVVHPVVAVVGLVAAAGCGSPDSTDPLDPAEDRHRRGADPGRPRCRQRRTPHPATTVAGPSARRRRAVDGVGVAGARMTAVRPGMQPALDVSPHT